MKKLITICFQLLFRFLSQMFPSQLWWLRSDRFELESCQFKIAAWTLSNSLTSFIIPGPPVQKSRAPLMTRDMPLSHIFQWKQSAQGGNTQDNAVFSPQNDGSCAGEETQKEVPSLKASRSSLPSSGRECEASRLLAPLCSILPGFTVPDDLHPQCSRRWQRRKNHLTPA